MLEGSLIEGGAASKPHSDTAAMVERAHDECRGSGSPQFVEKMVHYENVFGFFEVYPYCRVLMFNYFFEDLI